MVALLFTVEKAKQEGESLPAPQSCTSLRRSWGPRLRNIAPGPVQDVVVERTRFKKPDEVVEADGDPVCPPKHRAASVTSTLYEVCAREAENTTCDNIVSFPDGLKKKEEGHKPVRLRAATVGV